MQHDLIEPSLCVPGVSPKNLQHQPMKLRPKNRPHGHRLDRRACSGAPNPRRNERPSRDPLECGVVRRPHQYRKSDRCLDVSCHFSKPPSVSRMQSTDNGPTHSGASCYHQLANHPYCTALFVLLSVVALFCFPLLCVTPGTARRQAGAGLPV